MAKGFNYRKATGWTAAALAASAVLGMAAAAQAQITLGGNHTNVSCNGGANGTATVNPSGGLGTYTYSWSPSGWAGATAVGLTVGTYTVTVNDGVSTPATRSYTITQPTALSANAFKTDVTVNGGSDGTARVNVTGGTPGYTYSWSPTGGSAATATGLASGTYTVTIYDSNSCYLQHHVSVGEPAAVVAPTVSSVNVPANATYGPGNPLNFTVNFNQAITVDTTGGTPYLNLMVGSTTRQATYVSGSGSTALIFRYTVVAGDNDADGITIGTLNANGATLRNGSTDANLTLNSVGSTTSVLVSSPPPVPIPTLTEWSMILLTGVLALFGAARLGWLPAARKS